jgi:PhnB protein
MVQFKPDGYRSVTPYLIVSDGAAAIAFYCKVFGARERLRLPGPTGQIGHAELDIGDTAVMLADEAPAHGAFAPAADGVRGVSLHLYIENVDAVLAAAAAAGARIISPAETKFYGDRLGTLLDPFGHIWHVSTHVEDVPVDELQRRAAQAAGTA